MLNVAPPEIIFKYSFSLFVGWVGGEVEGWAAGRQFMGYCSILINHLYSLLLIFKYIVFPQYCGLVWVFFCFKKQGSLSKP